MGPDKRIPIKSPEAKPVRQELLDIIAETCHQTWVKQRSRDKGVPIDSISKEISDGDRERAQDALAELENNSKLTRAQAIDALAMSSHKMWLIHKEQERVRINGPVEILDLRPNEHDRERAEDIINALETRKVISFTK